MDYLNMNNEDGKMIDSLLAKDLSELTEEELNTVVEYKAAWLAHDNYIDQIKAERKKNADIIKQYDSVLNEESSKAFQEKLEAIGAMEYILEDD